MKKFFCKNCKEISYSSSPQSTQTEKDCPYCHSSELLDISDDIRIGRLLVMMGYIDKTALEASLEKQMVLKKRIGEILKLNRMITETQLSSALELQSRFVN